ncbi:MAG: hypothetical protein mread185_000303 [Mycoplasmataceae bacterium]|nr:MAG: hypothetical protein mread185_000303 [Mycoplasmataceae bacterium]
MTKKEQKKYKKNFDKFVEALLRIDPKKDSKR